MPKSTRRPSLKQLAFGFLMLMAKDVARAEIPMTTTGRPTPPSFTHCEHPLNDINPILTPSGLWSFSHFKDEAAVGNTVSFLTEHPEIQDICNQDGENYLFHLASHGSNDDFSKAVALSKPQHTHMKNLADESLMDVLIEQNNLHKINALVQTLREESFFRYAFKHLTNSLPELNKKDKFGGGLALVGLIAYEPMNPMNVAAKAHLIKAVDHDLTTYPAPKNNEYISVDLLIISMSISAPLIMALIFFYLFLYQRNDHNPGNNPNALFNQPNVPEEIRARADTKPRLS